MEIREDSYEGRAQLVVTTQNGTWWLDSAGGGFSRLIDPDGVDWLGFRKDPLERFPDSAAAGYRGMPNCLFGESNPDAGGGHPGFDRCISTMDGKHYLLTRTVSGRWAWHWTLLETSAVFTMEKVDDKHPWWFLYEGTVGGRYEPEKTFWATDTDGRQTRIPDIHNQHYGHWRWVYFGHEDSRWVLYLLREPSEHATDNLWFLGNERGGAADSPDGMLVFGFGRGPRSQALLQEAGLHVTVGFLEKQSHEALREQIERRMIP
jgi:hypothetical protein